MCRQNVLALNLYEVLATLILFREMYIVLYLQLFTYNTQAADQIIFDEEKK